MQHAIFPGSFDPITFGHLDLIERGARLCERLTIVIGVNNAKKTLFTPVERQKQIQQLVQHLANVDVVIVENDLIARYAQTQGATALLRGIRNTTDFEYEDTMAQANYLLASKVETVVLLAKPELRYVSSSLVKEIAHYGGDVSQLVPEVIQVALQQKGNAQEK